MPILAVPSQTPQAMHLATGRILGRPVRWGVYVGFGTFAVALIAVSLVFGGIAHSLKLNSAVLYPLGMVTFAGSQAAAVMLIKTKLINPAFRVVVFRPFARREHDLLRRIITPMLGKFGAVRVLVDPSAGPEPFSWTNWPRAAFRDARFEVASDNASWRAEVQGLIDGADAVVFYVDGWSRNLFWEWSRVIEGLPARRCLAVIDQGWAQSNPDFAEKLRNEAFHEWATVGASDGVGSILALEAATRRWLRSM